ncbi:mechanosensitive ion channel domain-containing protein [Pararhodonellum marinum]|uniref:mechanosensitive ion channel domain-containing protein n=1 Tax=Pararhodonellum marinum TaxID=2755358 RepID=UPI00188EBF6D|nr:mechanosensitive ion channel domain-containing protein [Pararhodonellum marinum]
MKKQIFAFFLGASVIFQFQVFSMEQEQSNSSKDLSIPADTTEGLPEHQEDLTQMEEQNKVQIPPLRQLSEEMKTQMEDIIQRDSIHRIYVKYQMDELKAISEGYPVAPFRDTLFFIYTRLGQLSAAERAENINFKIKEVFKTGKYVSDSLKVVSNNGFEDISYQDLILVSISPVDALWYEKTAPELAEIYKESINQALGLHFESNTIKEWLKKLGLVLLIILGVSLIVAVINRLFKRLGHYLSSKKEAFTHGFSFRNVQLFNAKDFERVTLQILYFTKLLAIFFAIYLSLPLLFSIFPETQEYTNTLLGWVLEPAQKALNGMLGFLPDLFTILVIYYIFHYAIKGIRFFVTEIEHDKIQISGFPAEWAQPTFSIVRFLLYAFMLVLIFPYLPGSGSEAFQGVSIFVGVIFSLGSTGAISNMIAGLVITYMRPFKLGDRIKINDITGDVIEKTMLVTRLRTPKNEDITIPNSTILSSNTVNFSANAKEDGPGLIVHTTVTIGYDVPWKKIHAALIEAACRTNMIMPKPKPFVLQTSLDDNYVAYQINAYTKFANKQPTIYSLLHQNIQDVCKEMDIEILSPHYRANRDGTESTIPSDWKSPE